ncbi:PAS domain S-box protein [Haloplanus sp. C73]|uniref:PAS domain S-box protein n=1 Tax=Haloplanus sp. C73 TaxID=3421641 RepID=UPI003EBD7418
MPEDGPRILLVDVPAPLRDRLVSPLRDAGFRVARTDSVGTCLGRVAADDVAAIVSGYDLATLDGVRLLRSVRVSHPTLPFVLVVADMSETVVEAALDASASGCVSADDDPEVVLDHLRGGFERAESVLTGEHQRRYRHLVEMSPAPINLFDETGESIWCNDATLDLLGLSGRDELIGRSVFEFVHPEDHALARRELEAVVRHKESVGPTQMRLRRADGEVRSVQVATAVGQFLGEDIGQAVILDITPLRETQAALEDERQFIDAALDTLEDVFYVVDAGGSLLRWNAAVTDVTGRAPDELASSSVETLFPGPDAARIRESIDTVLAEGSDTVEAALRTEHGTRPYEFRCRRLETPGDDPRVVGIGRDVSDRKERKRQLQALEQWLRHNIRNDMNVIRGIAENLEHGRLDDPEAGIARIRSYADHLIQQADRERRVVEILTDPPDAVSTDLSALVERRVADLSEQHPDADIACPRSDSVVVEALPDLPDALDELVANAIQYNDTGTPTVRIAIVDEGSRGLIRVTDDGPGIPEIERKTLQLDRDIDQLHHNTGLGLLFVYWVTRLSGGDVTISENDSRGSTVTLSFPSR